LLLFPLQGLANFTWAIFVCTWGSSYCFLAYDCMNRTTRTSKYDVLEPGDCIEPEADYEEPVEQNVQILQSVDDVQVTGFHCRATVTRTVARCEFTSITYGGTAYVEYDKNVEITPQQCRTIELTKKFVFENRKIAVPNAAAVTETYYSHGSRDGSGNCETDSWWRNNVQHKKSLEQTVFRIQAQKRTATASLADNTIVFRNSLQGDYRDGNIQDASEGTMVWEVAESNCTQDVSSVYYGKAQVHQPKQGSGKPTLVLIEEPAEQRAVGLILGKPCTVCGTQAFRTQIRGLSLVLMRPRDTKLMAGSKVQTSPKVDQDLRGQNSYLHLTAQLTIQSSFREMARHLCELERSVLQTKLNLLATSSRPLFGKALFGEGKRARVAGRVAYISDCPAIEVSRMDYPNCTVEIPVRTSDNRHLFADPLTFFLVESPTVVPCDALSPVMWKVGGNWFCSLPQLSDCKPPEVVNPGLVQGALYELNFSGFDGSVFTADQWEQHERSLRTYDTRTAVVSDLANVAMSNRESNHGLDMGVNGILTVADLSSVTLKIGGAILPFFSALGHTYSFCIGTLIVCSWIKMLAGWFLRTRILYKRFGCSARLLAGFWSTLTAIFMLPLATLNHFLHQVQQGSEHPGGSDSKGNSSAAHPGAGSGSAKEAEALSYNNRAPWPSHPHLVPWQRALPDQTAVAVGQPPRSSGALPELIPALANLQEGPAANHCTPPSAGNQGAGSEAQPDRRSQPGPQAGVPPQAETTVGLGTDCNSETAPETRAADQQDSGGPRRGRKMRSWVKPDNPPPPPPPPPTSSQTRPVATAPVEGNKIYPRI
jgi:hypothetical protein